MAFPKRCMGIASSTGERCKSWAKDGSDYCHWHDLSEIQQANIIKMVKDHGEAIVAFLFGAATSGVIGNATYDLLKNSVSEYMKNNTFGTWSEEPSFKMVNKAVNALSTNQSESEVLQLAPSEQIKQFLELKDLDSLIQLLVKSIKLNDTQENIAKIILGSYRFEMGLYKNFRVNIENDGGMGVHIRINFDVRPVDLNLTLKFNYRDRDMILVSCFIVMTDRDTDRKLNGPQHFR